jgi:SAM-dependent methyltransferase
MISKIINLLFKKNIKVVQKYSSYNEYIIHQKKKTEDPKRRSKWLNEEWDLKLNYFQTRFEEYRLLYFKSNFKRAVGLGARTGQEVQAFINLGYEAIGLDIVPCEPLVIEGDIHQMPFKDSEFDIAFTNIFDHSLYPEKFANEIQRILRSNGVAILHIAVGTETDPFGVIEIPSASLVIQLFNGMKLLKSSAMPEWGGGLNWQIILVKV